MLKLFDKIIVSLSTYTLVDSNCQFQYLVNENIIVKGKAVVLGNGSISGVDVDLFKSCLDNKKMIRSKLGLSDNEIVILFLGRINRDKGILDLIKAFKNLRKNFKNVFLLVVGYDEELLIGEIKKDLMSDKFMYIGPVVDPIPFYQASDIFCLPSYREGFGTSVIEASSCELPIVCSDIYGLNDSIIDGVTGEKFIVGNHFDLYEKLKKFIENKDIRVNIGINGRKFVENRFSKDLVSKAWEDFYNKLLTFT